MELAVANQYAKALMEVVSKPGSTLSAETALEQLSTVSAAIRESRDLRGVMMTPAVGRDAKRRILTRIGELLGLHPIISNFLVVVTNHRRAGLFQGIRDMFQAQLDERRGVVRATVVAVRELSATQKEALAESLRGRVGKQVLCEYSVDPALVGGVTVKIGSTMYDGSVQGQLEALRRRLASQA
jgi:F-type H+-transporting ATPase subunit delta